VRGQQHLAVWPRVPRRQNASVPVWTAAVAVSADAMGGVATLAVTKIRPRVVSGGLLTEG
jgi:hypothetical protein